MRVVENQEILDKVEQEMAQATLARQQGKEGRARVCARRAAGWAVAAYRRRELGLAPDSNAYQMLCWFQGVTEAPCGLREAASRLTTRVTTDYTLPHSQDPLEDANLLVEALLKEAD